MQTFLRLLKVAEPEKKRIGRKLNQLLKKMRCYYSPQIATCDMLLGFQHAPFVIDWAILVVINLKLEVLS